jgi:hypothetical protein
LNSSGCLYVMAVTPNRVRGTMLGQLGSGYWVFGGAWQAVFSD